MESVELLWMFYCISSRGLSLCSHPQTLCFFPELAFTYHDSGQLTSFVCRKYCRCWSFSCRSIFPGIICLPINPITISHSSWSSFLQYMSILLQTARCSFQVLELPNQQCLPLALLSPFISRHLLGWRALEMYLNSLEVQSISLDSFVVQIKTLPRSEFRTLPRY